MSDDNNNIEPGPENIDDLESEEVLWERIPKVSGVERAHTFYELSARIYARGQFDEALALAESARDLYAQVDGEVEGLAGAYSAIGYNLNQLERIDEAADAMSKAVDLLRNSKSPLAIDLACTLGEWLFTSQEFDRAIECMEDCVQEHLIEGNNSGAANDLQLIGSAYLELNKPDRALERFMEAKELFMEDHEVLNVGRSELKIAKSLIKMNDGESALICANRALDIFITARDTTREKRALECVAQANILLQNNEEALDVLEQVLESLHKEENKDFPFIIEVEKKIAEVLLLLDRNYDANKIMSRLATVEDILNSQKEIVPLDGEISKE